MEELSFKILTNKKYHEMQFKAYNNKKYMGSILEKWVLQEHRINNLQKPV